jgi:hypothetical protein
LNVECYIEKNQRKHPYTDIMKLLHYSVTPLCTRADGIVRGLTLLLRVRTLWRCGDGLFFEVPPLASDALLTKIHPLLENVLQTVCRKLQKGSGTGGFLASEQPSHGWKSPEIAWGEIWTP